MNRCWRLTVARFIIDCLCRTVGAYLQGGFLAALFVSGSMPMLTDDGDKAQLLADVCMLLSERKTDAAVSLLNSRYPFIPPVGDWVKPSNDVMVRIFHRDAYTCRYTGRRLFHPGALKLINIYLPTAFPYQRHGKYTECHLAYWELFPSIDHIVPQAAGGTNCFANLATTSMAANAIKSNWRLKNLGWSLHPVDPAWDGMRNWFLSRLAEDANLRLDPYVRKWEKLAIRELKLAETEGMAPEPCLQ